MNTELCISCEKMAKSSKDVIKTDAQLSFMNHTISYNDVLALSVYLLVK